MNETALTPIRCTDCEQSIELQRKENHVLVATCECEHQTPIQVARGLPRQWEA